VTRGISPRKRARRLHVMRRGSDGPGGLRGLQYCDRNTHMHTREGPGVVRGEGVDRIALSVVLCCGTRDVVSSERVTPHGHNNKDWYANPHNGTTAGTQTKCQGVSRHAMPVLHDVRYDVPARSTSLHVMRRCRVGRGGRWVAIAHTHTQCEENKCTSIVCVRAFVMSSQFAWHTACCERDMARGGAIPARVAAPACSARCGG
jgi:hypothetical protein